MRPQFWGLGLGIWVLGFAAACSQQPQPDAYGNVEATEVVVSSEVGGQLTTFTVEEGQTLAAGDKAGTVDPTQLTLAARAGDGAARRQRCRASAKSITRRRPLRPSATPCQAQHDAAARSGALFSRSSKSRSRNHERTQRLFAQQAATAQQLDQAERDDRVLEIRSRRRTSRSRRRTRQVARAERDRSRSRAQQRTTAPTQVAARRRAGRASVGRAHPQEPTITNPIAGTVLVTYAKAGEVVQPGSRSTRSPISHRRCARLRRRAAAGAGAARAAGAGQRRRRRQASGRRSPAPSRGSRRRPSSRRRRFRRATSAPTSSTRSRSASPTRMAC